MAKKVLKVSTPHGEFTRSTDAAYSHVVVAIPASRFGDTYEDAADLVAELQDRNSSRGVFGRVLKDRGYIVSWHSSLALAAKAAEKGNSPYFKTRDAQVFEVAS
jgi:hypothetical protein